MKMLSINLWYNRYSSKTNMQLQSYRKLGFCTHLFTIIKQDNTLHAQIHDVTETDSSLIYDLEYSAYFKPFVYYSIFKDLSRYISSYDFIYIRRLMSKIFFIVPFMQEINKNTNTQSNTIKITTKNSSKLTSSNIKKNKNNYYPAVIIAIIIIILYFIRKKCRTK